MPIPYRVATMALLGRVECRPQTRSREIAATTRGVIPLRPPTLYGTTRSGLIACSTKPSYPKAGPRTVEPRTAEPRTAEPRTAEPRTAKPRTAEPRTVEPRTAKPRTAERLAPWPYQ